MFRYKFSLKVLVLLICLTADSPMLDGRADAQPITKVVASSTDSSPDGNGNLSEFENAVTQRRNEAVFSATIRNNGFLVGTGIFRARMEPGSLEGIVYEGQPSPDGNGNFSSVSGDIPFTNRSGQVGFDHILESTLGGFGDAWVVFSGNGGAEQLPVVVRGQQTVPNTGGDQFASFFIPVGYNDAGEVAFFAQTQINGDIGIWRGDDTGGDPVRIVSEGDTSPSGDGILAGGTLNFPAAMNEGGQVTFHDQVFLDGGGSELGIFRGASSQDLVKIARTGDPIPSGSGTYFSFLRILPPLISGSLSINDHGDVAFGAALTGTSGGTSDNAGLFRGSGSTMIELVRKGDPVPGGNGLFLEIGYKQIILNNPGQVLFQASVTGAVGGASEGVFLVDGTQIKEIARLKGPAPEGGTFESFGDVMALNNAGQAVFLARVDTGTSSEDGLFFYGGDTLHSVIREGDLLPGFGAVTSVVTSTGLEGEGRPERSLLNDYGQVVYTFFAGGEAGVALWTQDPPLFADGFESGDTSVWSFGTP